jgi:hypothetical protein
LAMGIFPKTNEIVDMPFGRILRYPCNQLARN